MRPIQQDSVRSCCFEKARAAALASLVVGNRPSSGGHALDLLFDVFK